MRLSTLSASLLTLLVLFGFAPVLAQRVAAGNNFTLSVHSDGTLWAWGNNNGVLGLGNRAYQTVPQQVGTDTNWRSVSAGNNHVVALKTNGTLWTWGSNDAGQLGLGTTYGSKLMPTQVGTATDWRSISAGNGNSFAIRTDGTLWAWGGGKLGFGTTTNQNTPAQVGVATWLSVSANGQTVAAIGANNTLWAWGSGNEGQLGLGSITTQLSPAQVGTAATWASVSTGVGQTLAVRQDGTLWAWGSNRNGQLGLGTTTTQTTPQQVGTTTTWVSVSTGYLHTLAVRQDGSLWAWGYNRYGQLGTGPTNADQLTPARVGTANTWASISAGYYHSAALYRDGSLWAWGANFLGQVGAGPGAPQLMPAQITSTPTWRTVAAGFYKAIGIRTDGSLWAWGGNSSGNLGTGDQLDRDVPTPVGGAATWQNVTIANSVTLAVRQDGTLWAWGDNQNGQLGTGAALTYLTTTSVQVGTASNWQSVLAGPKHVLALRQDGTLWAWGSNESGQLGNGTTTPQISPIQVGTATWLSIGLGLYHSSAVRADGTLWTWGTNSNGQLGTGTGLGSLVPVPTQVGTATNWASVAGGIFHNLALRQDGTLWGWGWNDNNTLGTGMPTNSQLVPVQVSTATTWRSVSAGPNATLALRQDGTLWVWGSNDTGQLGLGNTTIQPTPMQRGATTWQSASLGAGFGAGIRPDGTLWTWGFNDTGQLGNGLPGSAAPRYVANGGAVLATAAPAGPPPAWSLAPNPAHGQVQLLGLPAGPPNVCILDAQGRLVRTATTTLVNIQGLAPGLYLVQATAGQTTQSLRLSLE